MRLYCLVLASLFVACSATPPSLMLVIDAEANVRARTTRIELDVRGAEGNPVFAQNYDLTARGLPIRRSFVPRDGNLSRFIVATVSAYEAGTTTPLLVSRIRSGFAHGQNEVRVLLLDGCIGQPCSDGNTCVVESGSPRCVPTPEVVPVRDAGVVDGRAVSDASTSDTTVCTPNCQGRNCGVDPICGTSCGTCTAGRCNIERGLCEDVQCTPSCTGRMCGADPVCGQSCGTCTSGTCNASGQCEVACMPDCQGRTCGTESRCNTSCGACDSPQVCSTAGRCETMTSNGPRFLDAPTISGVQPIAVGGSFTLNMTVTDPQGVDTIVQAEVRNPTGVAGVDGRYQVLNRRAGTGEYSATIRWTDFSASNGGLPEDVSGVAMRALRIRFLDQDGNELVQDVSVRLGGCAEALCGGRCVACPSNVAARMCTSGRCIASTCGPDFHVCDNGTRCADDRSPSSCGASCTPCPNSLPNGVPSCSGGGCGYDCQTGFHMCNAQCVRNNTDSCGVSCLPCPAPPVNAVATCDGVACGFACTSGYHRCDNRCVSDVSTIGCDMCNAGYMRCNGDCVANRFVDGDADGYGSTVSCVGTVTRSPDCNDDDRRAFPGASPYYDRPMANGSFDYNCNGRDDPATSNCDHWTDGACGFRSVPGAGELQCRILGCEPSTWTLCGERGYRVICGGTFCSADLGSVETLRCN